MPRLTESERAYAAGLFDGEGSVHITGRKWHNQLQVNVSQVDPRPLVWLKERFGGNLGVCNRPSDHQVCYRWQTQASNAEAFLRSVYPFLIVKQPHAIVAFELRDGQRSRRGGPALPADELERRRVLKDRMHDLNVKGSSQKEARRA